MFNIKPWLDRPANLIQTIKPYNKYLSNITQQEFGHVPADSLCWRQLSSCTSWNWPASTKGWTSQDHLSDYALLSFGLEGQVNMYLHPKFIFDLECRHETLVLRLLVYDIWAVVHAVTIGSRWASTSSELRWWNIIQILWVIHRKVEIA